ncbi:HSPB1-associated protein 1 homolog isoform X1 [Gouania willdenowi]|nr:HSPB1-associated protein 1 isoform X1 [Gouania willdenowi]XP_028291126.1 HSPB1-associated protein 1 isoform X1 [Gouania willdenowi]
MATITFAKPFSPEESRRILDQLQQPLVFLNMTCDWPALSWTAQHLSDRLGDKRLRFRLGRKKDTHEPLFESQCSYVEATLAEFLCWTVGHTPTENGPFSNYPQSDYWAYADYKYIAMLFQDQPSMFEDVKWSDFGFEGRGGRESTLWIGTEGANTPCHLDSYGCNLVLQVQGRKRWHLFPPEDTAYLYPTRIPYEESSVFSQVNVLHPDLTRLPDFSHARVHIVTLQPGQVLFVPRHWWHYVESVDPITVSVNSWIELDCDDRARVSEAVTRTLVCAIKAAPSDDNTDVWLNPTEKEVLSHDENMQYVNLAVRAWTERQICHKEPVHNSKADSPPKRDSRGQTRTNKKPNPATFSIPYGPCLIPVRCQHEGETRIIPEEDGSLRDFLVTSQEPCTGTTSTSESKHEHRPVLNQSKSHDSTDRTLEDNKGAGHPTITTNDLLDCLLHPDVISCVTDLLLQRNCK